MRKATISLLIVSMLCMYTTSIHAESGADQKVDTQVEQVDTHLDPQIEATSLKTQPAVLLNGEEMNFSNSPFILEWITLAPADALLTQLGYTVKWDEPTQTLTANKEEKEMQFTINSGEATVNGKTSLLLKAPRMVEGVPFIPLRFAAEADGRKVRWQESTKTITIDEKVTDRIVQIVLPLQETGNLLGEYEKLSDLMYTQSGIRIEWVLVQADYQQRLNLMIASGDLPHLGYVPYLSDYPPYLIPSIAWDLSDYIKDYPNLARLPQQSWEDVRASDGGIYGIPKVISAYDGSFPVIRQDWLDKLGLVNPTTMNELYEVMKLFTEYDPDGNGKKDTIGLSGSSQGEGLLGSLTWVLHVFNESQGRFMLEDGVIKDTVVEEGTKEALLWLNKAYADGLLDAEFPVMTDKMAKRSLESQRSGIMAMTMEEAWETQAAIQKSDSFAMIAPLISLKRDNSSAAVTGARPAHDGMFFIGKMSTKEEMEQALATMDALYASETDMSAGIEMEALIEQTFGVNAEHELPIPQLPEDIRLQFEGTLLERSKLKVKPVIDAGIKAKLSNDHRFTKQELDQEIIQMQIKVILGAASIQQWDDFVAKLESDKRYVKLMLAIQS